MGNVLLALLLLVFPLFEHISGMIEELTFPLRNPVWRQFVLLGKLRGGHPFAQGIKHHFGLELGTESSSGFFIVTAM